MKNKLFPCCISLALILALLFAGLPPGAASAPATDVPEYITTDTVWTEAGSPYLVSVRVIVTEGATLTIEPGVVVASKEDIITSYSFQVEGTLIAKGTAAKPIHFNTTTEGWSGIDIYGEAGKINTGSILEYVILDGGGFGESGVAANLNLSYSEVTVRNCQFKNSPGDGILGNNTGSGGVAHVYDSSFTNNAGYAINFENGTVNPVLSNLTAGGNGPGLPYGGDMVYINNDVLSGAHTWENMGLPYLIEGTIVGPDAVLTIEPGVSVLATPGYNAFDVQGRLLANGTANQPIHFGPADGTEGWAGIYILGTETKPSTGNQLSYVTVKKGGFFGPCNLNVEYGDVTVTHSRFEGSDDSGVCLDRGGFLSMADTELADNQDFAINIFDAGSNFEFADLAASGNGDDMVGIWGGTITSAHTLSKSGINTYFLHQGAVIVGAEGALNIEPGVTVLFEYGRDLTVNGTLNAIGTASEPILFSSPVHEPGQWAGITIAGIPEKHATGNFKYVTMEYGGYGGAAMLDLVNANVRLEYCTLMRCSADAIRVREGVNPGAAPSSLLAEPSVQVSWSRFNAVDGYAIDNRLPTQAVKAIYNWWGSKTGPKAGDNPEGTGSEINGLVIYRPYLIDENASFIFLPYIRTK